jgi:hypothetical protein
MPQRQTTTVQQGIAQLTDEQIAMVMNYRESTDRHNRKNVSFHRCTAEKKLKKRLGDWFSWLIEELETK